jgi:hypothetical protein
MDKEYFFSYWANDIHIKGDMVSYKLSFSIDKMKFMADHFFGGKCLLPAAMLAEMMIDASSLLFVSNDKTCITIDSLDIYHGLKASISDEIFVMVISQIYEKNEVNSKFKAKIIANLKNSKGKIVRKDIIFSEAKIILSNNKDKVKESYYINDEELVNYYFGQERYYNYFSTHKYLFQSFTGKFKMPATRTSLISEFKLGNKENAYSIVPGLKFHLSPLGFDSILQTAVCLSVFSGEVEGEEVYSKIPVSIQGFKMFSSFNSIKKFYCRVETTMNSYNKMELSAIIYNSSNEIVGIVDKILLKNAPFLSFRRSSIEKIIGKQGEVEDNGIKTREELLL